jgi:hypothetical protein
VQEAMTGLVECRSDAAYGERPQWFIWQGERLEVAQVTGRWRSPHGWGFRVKTGQALAFELFYDQTSDQWTVTEC